MQNFAIVEKKPVRVKAWQLKTTNVNRVLCWIENAGGEAFRNLIGIVIPTLERNRQANYGDWIIQGIEGEFYPCKPHIFEQTYRILE